MDGDLSDESENLGNFRRWRPCKKRASRDQIDPPYVIRNARSLSNGSKKDYSDMTLDVSGTVTPVNCPVDHAVGARLSTSTASYERRSLRCDLS
ncbi:hypothetical protein MRX96_044294 [Rhipicephalus microplus]